MSGGPVGPPFFFASDPWEGYPMNDGSQQLYREMSDLIRRGDPAAAVTRLTAWTDTHPGDDVALSLLGSALMRCHNHDAALEIFRRAVTANPNSFAAHGDLAFALMQAAQAAEAMQVFARAVALHTGFYQGWCFLARLQYESGLLDSARKSFDKSQACDPYAAEFPKIQAAMSASRFAEAEKIARGLLAQQAGYPKAAYALAHLATSVGAHEEAAKILGKSIEIYPCDINLRAALVTSLEETGDYARACAEAQHIAPLDPGSYAPWLIIGRVHGHCGQYEESLAAYDMALTLAAGDPHQAGNIQLLRGHILKILGRYADGISAYRASIETVDNNGAGWWGLADMKTHRFSAADRATMQRFAEDSTIKPEQRTQAAFALAKALEDSAAYADAFHWYQTANNLRTDSDFDPATNSAGIDELIATFSQPMLENAPATASDEATPVFVVGLPRSGSTLIEQILASHSEIEGTMELTNLPNVVRLMTIAGGKYQLPYPASVAKFSRDELLAFGRNYMDSTAVYRTGKAFFIDKLPTNFDKVGLIHMLLPQAIIIDARRHPLDCGLSCFKQHFAGGHRFSYKLEHIGHYYNNYLRMMDHWDAVLPQKVLRVQYESMVSQTEETVRDMLRHCGVAFEDNCLRFFANKRAVRTASSEQVRQPIYTGSVRSWKNFETELLPLIAALGEDTLARFADI